MAEPTTLSKALGSTRTRISPQESRECSVHFFSPNAYYYYYHGSLATYQLGCTCISTTQERFVLGNKHSQKTAELCPSIGHRPRWSNAGSYSFTHFFIASLWFAVSHKISMKSPPLWLKKTRISLELGGASSPCWQQQ